MKSRCLGRTQQLRSGLNVKFAVDTQPGECSRAVLPCDERRDDMYQQSTSAMEGKVWRQ